jgi:predicted metal-dependent HD superfamily phosphohydrolase
MFEAWAADVPGLGARVTNRIAGAILDTSHGGDGALMGTVSQYTVDADLSILGTNAETFDAYDRAIRAEYDFVPEEQYRAGRMAVLREFLERPSIYVKLPFQRAFEAQARVNLQRAIDRLREGP